MAKRQRLKEKLYLEENKEEEEKLKSVAAMTSDDDDEANEDFSLKIVEKHLLMRAAKVFQDDDNNNSNVLLDDGSKKESVVVAGPIVTTDAVIIEDVKSDKKKIRVHKKKKKEVKKMEIDDQSVTVAKEEQKVETVENGDEAVKAVEISDNIVMRRLLRGPRYFDPPDSSWQTCYNCCEEGHMAVNCPSAVKRKKPCFICGSLEHGVKQCSKAHDCFICKKSGHRAKDCQDKRSWNAQVCLNCGDSGHDMFSCRNSYSLDDLKEVQCYICKSFGHLCCVNISDTSPREVSCFRCGLSGHTGLACTSSRAETAEASPSSCYKCRREGHFARECVSSVKVCKRNIDTSTPTLRHHRENKDNSGVKTAPHDLGKARKKKKTRNEERGITTPQKSKQRGGWITDDPGDISNGKLQRNCWRSTGTSSGKSHKISAVASVGYFPSPQPVKKSTSHHKYPVARFDNSGSNGISRGYDW